MKKAIILSASILSVFTLNSLKAQVSIDKAKEYLSISSGAQNVDKKVLKEPVAQFFPYVALKFRTASVEMLGAGSGKEQARAKAYAVVEGLDSAFYQEITNEFAKIWEAKLKEAGLTLVEMDKVIASKGYNKFKEEPAARDFNHPTYGTSHVYTQNNLPFFYPPVAGMKGAKWMQELNAGHGELRLTIDFVEWSTEAEKYWKDYGTYKEKGFTFSANVIPGVKISTPAFAEGTLTTATNPEMYGGLSISNNKNFFSTSLMLTKPIFNAVEAKVDTYDGKKPEFISKKWVAFSGAMNLGTFVVTPNKEQYKAAAIKGLTEFADYFVAIAKSYKE